MSDTCASHLRAVIVAAIDTGVEHGELLSLQWAQVQRMQVKGRVITRASKAALFLPAAKTRTRRIGG
jgi:hypothetical protein